MQTSSHCYKQHWKYPRHSAERLQSAKYDSFIKYLRSNAALSVSFSQLKKCTTAAKTRRSHRPDFTGKTVHAVALKHIFTAARQTETMLTLTSSN